MGVGSLLAQSQRILGHYSRVLVSAPHPFGFAHDYCLPRTMKLMEWRKHFDFDVLHSHDTKKLPSMVARHWKNKLVQHYHNGYMDLPHYGKDIPSLVSLPSLLEKVPWAEWLPLPVDTSLFLPKKTEHEAINVGYSHQNADPDKTRYIPYQEIKSVTDDTIKATPLTEVINRSMMMDYYSTIDVWVDRIGLDFYGFSAIEMASMGIPVIAQIGQEEMKYVGDCPFHLVESKNEIGDAVMDLASNEEHRKRVGKRCRDFVIANHDSRKVAERTIDFYKEMVN